MRYRGTIIRLKTQLGILLFNETYQEVFMSLVHTTIYSSLVYTKAVVIKVNHSTNFFSQARPTSINLRLANISGHRSSPNDGNNKSTANMILSHRGFWTCKKPTFPSIYRHKRLESRRVIRTVVVRQIQTKSKIWIFSHPSSPAIEA
jgi:hypothetical protein